MVSLFRKKKKSTKRDLRRLIVGASKTKVFGVAQQNDLRKFALHHIAGAVGRSVVYDDHFQFDARLTKDRQQTSAQMIAAIPIGDAHRNVYAERRRGWLVDGETAAG